MAQVPPGTDRSSPFDFKSEPSSATGTWDGLTGWCVRSRTSHVENGAVNGDVESTTRQAATTVESQDRRRFMGVRDAEPLRTGSAQGT